MAAKFLYYDEKPVLNPNFGKAPPIEIYDENGNLLPAQNMHGYLIVPADYSLKTAINFAQSVSGQTNVDFFDGLDPEGEILAGSAVGNQ